ncbi:MAG: Holliday junction resolvase RuvX [Clostridia bacterium]|nr:Holliday junction resolvase RuvX [Clostridia bacterium]
MSDICNISSANNSGAEAYHILNLKDTTGALLGVDFGDKRTGLAVCDALRMLAAGIGTISPGGIEKTADAIAEEAKRRGVSGIVIGHPINMDGSEGPRSRRAVKLARLLSERTALPIGLFDERMSTMNAARFLNETNTRGEKRKSVIDTLSAEIILQNAIDRLKNT